MSLYAVKVKSYNPIAYWPGYEASGSVATCLINPAQSGAYTGVTLGQTGIGDGWTCPLWDGVNDYTDVYSPTFRDAFSGVAGTVALWAKVSGAGVWTDGTRRLLFELFGGPNDYIFLERPTGNNIVRTWYRSGAVSHLHDFTTSTTDWFHLALTWDDNAGAAGEVEHYLNGAAGTSDVGTPAWATSLDSTRCLVGALTKVPASVWDGYLAHWAVWTSALTAAQIADLYIIPAADITAMSALTAVDTIAKAIQDVARGLSGMRAAPKYPLEKAPDFPFAVTYPRGGELSLRDEALLTNDMVLVTEIHLAHRDLAVAAEQAYPFLERFMKGMLADLTLSAAFNSGTIMPPINHRFGFLDYFGGTTIGWTFEIPVVTRGPTS